MQRKLGRWVWGMVAFWGLIGAVLAVVALNQRPTAEGPEPPAAEVGLRTVVVSGMGPGRLSSPDGPVHVSLVAGDVDAAPVVATVLTDEDCQPDALGYSHCLNELEMPDGRRIAVRHTHRMAEVACLSPGERVNLEVA